MESVTFKTLSSNCYLYSPVQKEIIPIPKSLYDDLELGKSVNSTLYSVLKDIGYFDEYTADLSERISEQDIKNALQNVSQVVFEMTTNCNLKCEYCCYGDGYTTFKSRKSGNINFKTAKTILDYFSNMLENKSDKGVMPEPFAISFYGGEPLMNFSVIKEIVEYAENIKFKEKSLVFTMTTNAILLDKYADFLSKHNFRILVSLDGNKTHDSYRRTHTGKESFDIVYRNLKYVEENYPILFKAIHFNSVYTDKSNAGDIIRFFASEFGKTTQFSLLHEPEPKAKKADKIKSIRKSLEIPDDIRMQKDIIMESPIHKRILEICTKLSKYSYRDESKLLEKISYVSYPTGTCIPFSKRVFVSHNGDLHPCEKINRSKSWGKLDANGNLTIDFHSIVERYNRMLDKHEYLCSTCYLQQCCTKCVLQSENAICNNRKTKEQFKEILSQTYSYIEDNPEIVKILKENVIIK